MGQNLRSSSRFALGGGQQLIEVLRAVCAEHKLHVAETPLESLSDLQQRQCALNESLLGFVVLERSDKTGDWHAHAIRIVHVLELLLDFCCLWFRWLWIGIATDTKLISNRLLLFHHFVQLCIPIF